MPASPVSQPGAFCLLCTVLFSFFPLFIIFFILSQRRKSLIGEGEEAPVLFFFFMGNSVTLQRNVNEQPFLCQSCASEQLICLLAALSGLLLDLWRSCVS